METIYIPRHKLDVDEMVDVSISRSRPMLLARTLLAGILVVAVVQLAFGNDPSVENPLLFGLLGGLLVSCLLWLLWRPLIKWRYRRPESLLLFEERMMMLEEKGVRIEYVNGISSFFPWHVVRKAEWTPHVLLFYFGPQYVAVPRRALGPELEQVIRDRLETAKTSVLEAGAR